MSSQGEVQIELLLVCDQNVWSISKCTNIDSNVVACQVSIMLRAEAIHWLVNFC